jgi:hypothetical protein
MPSGDTFREKKTFTDFTKDLRTSMMNLIAFADDYNDSIHMYKVYEIDTEATIKDGNYIHFIVIDDPKTNGIAQDVQDYLLFFGAIEGKKSNSGKTSTPYKVLFNNVKVEVWVREATREEDPPTFLLTRKQTNALGNTKQEAYQGGRVKKSSSKHSKNTKKKRIPKPTQKKLL